MSFGALYATLALPSETDTEFAVVEARSGVFVARDGYGAPAVLLRCSSSDQGRPSPVRLELIEVAYDVPCTVRLPSGASAEALTVLRCRSGDAELQSYFLDCLEAAVVRLRDSPSRREVVATVSHLATLFAAQTEPPRGEVQGLWGELVVIRAAPSCVAAIRSWHTDNLEKFDFAAGAERIEVKTYAREPRSHVFRYDQIRTLARIDIHVASIHVRPMAGGLSLRSLLEHIRLRLGPNIDALAKLERVVAQTMGSALLLALDMSFDYENALQSIRFFPAASIPSVPSPLPAGVSEVSFRAELSEEDGTEPTEVLRSHRIFRNFTD